LDKTPLGNLSAQTIGEIWHGAAYREFRTHYRQGEIAQCRTCPWKRAYLPRPRVSEILASRGFSAQLLHGWHEPSGEEHVWSSQDAAAVLQPRSGSRTLHVCGILPPGAEISPNELSVSVNGVEVGRVTNPWQENMPFGLDFPMSAEQSAPWMLEFRTRHVYRPCDRGAGADRRDLGFALVLVASKEFVDPARVHARAAPVRRLRRFVEEVDRQAIRVARHYRRALRPPVVHAWRPGLSIVIPEWDNVEELARCLAAVREAGRQWYEPLDTIVVVNGSPAAAYHGLRQAHPNVRWRFYDRPLGFSRAVRAGLKWVKYEWSYLLNSDVTLDPSSLREVGSRRSEATFSVASQVVLKDGTRFRDETNWTTLLLESGLATIHDCIPKSNSQVPTFYAGGGASLFRTSLLRKFMTSVYDPFYWEDVEWGWRARKLGYDSWHCPASIARHSQRATIGRHYSAEAVERIVSRNRLLFQLRNFTSAGSLECVLEEISRAPEPVAAFFQSPETYYSIARGRWWNHLAPLTDQQVFQLWNDSIGGITA
jgi:GT2 family glycosyltransferase